MKRYGKLTPGAHQLPVERDPDTWWLADTIKEIRQFKDQGATADRIIMAPCLFTWIPPRKASRIRRRAAYRKWKRNSTALRSYIETMEIVQVGSVLTANRAP